MNVPALPPELPCIWTAVAAYALATTGAMVRATGGPSALRHGPALERCVIALLAAAVSLLAMGIAVRWLRIGHGPFLNMFEILASSLLSLGLLYGVVYWRMHALRGTAVVVFPLLLMLSVWLVVTSAADTHLPPTYDTSVLWFHVGFGKLFLGCALVAVGIAGVILARRLRRPVRWFAGMPGDAALEALAWKFMLGALVFESSMLIAGAIWAQDAWGRYWAWDPLETWSFITWIALAASMHARIALRISARTGAVLIVAVFVLAFLTFFGVPFVSMAPHKGAV